MKHRLRDPSCKPYLLLDGASAHRGKLAREYLETNFKPLFMPPYSPQFNSIEMIWPALKHRVRLKLLERLDHKHTQDEFKEIVSECCKTVFKSCAFNVVRANYGYLHKVLQALHDRERESGMQQRDGKAAVPINEDRGPRGSWC